MQTADAGEAAESPVLRGSLGGPGREEEAGLVSGQEALTGWQCRGLQGGRRGPLWSVGRGARPGTAPRWVAPLWPLTSRLLAWALCPLCSCPQ